MNSRLMSSIERTLLSCTLGQLERKRLIKKTS